MLKGKIAAVEAQMKARPDELRSTFTCAGDKGVKIEDIFRKFLREYLPRRLEVGVGEVVDTRTHSFPSASYTPRESQSRRGRLLYAADT